jgi:hypothetical protein
MNICLLAQTLAYVEGGGHFWIYMNWALGFQRAGVRVIWLETVARTCTPEKFLADRALLIERLRTYGMTATLAFIREDGQTLSEEFGALPTLSGIAEESDLLVSLFYRLPDSVVRQFRRKALIDIDPGLLQNWVTRGYVTLAHYDFHFTISDAIGTPGNPIPTLGLRWYHTPPCVDTLSWPVTVSTAEAPFTTISHWEAEEFVVEDDGSFYENTKKVAFEPILPLVKQVATPLELVLCIDPGQIQELQRLRDLGWRIRPSVEIATTPESYQQYVQQARGEFSVSKPSYRKMQAGWVSDRTICFLSSGKPVLVQDTGPIGYLPSGPGFLRFQTIEEAIRQLKSITDDYATHAQAARHLAETIFDACLVAEQMLDITVG